jgi:hypothetical protein
MNKKIFYLMTIGLFLILLNQNQSMGVHLQRNSGKYQKMNDDLKRKIFQQHISNYGKGVKSFPNVKSVSYNLMSRIG